MTRASTGSCNWAFTIYLFTATYMLAFLCRIPFNPYFTELYIPSFFADSRSPCFSTIIAIPQLQIFRMACPMSFGVALQRLRVAYQPYPPPPHRHHHPSHQLQAPSCTQPCMHVFIFRFAYPSSPNSGKHMYFLKIPIPYHFSELV